MASEPARFLVDTDVVSELARTRPRPGVVRWLSAQSRIVVSSVTVYELEVGIEATASERKRLFLEEWLSALLAGDIDVLPFDGPATRAAAQLQADALRRGRPIETRDLFILATARAAGLHVATGNVRHVAGRGVLVVDPFMGGV